jgi:hypothetical protein
MEKETSLEEMGKVMNAKEGLTVKGMVEVRDILTIEVRIILQIDMKMEILLMVEDAHQKKVTDVYRTEDMVFHQKDQMVPQVHQDQ